MDRRKIKKPKEKRAVIFGMNPSEALQALETLARALEVEVRTEKGEFQSGLCHVHGKNVLFLRRDDTTDKKIDVLARELATFNLDQLYIVPAIRQLLEQSKLQNQSI